VSYAIIRLGGKQYRVREGERLLVDRVAVEDGETFTPNVLLVGGDGEAQLDPKGVVVTAKVLGQQRGPKIRIGKYKKRTGYRRHTGFRAALTQIEIESIGSASSRSRAKRTETSAEAPKAAETEAPKPAPEPPPTASALPEGYGNLTVAAVKEAAGSWDVAALQAALEHEQAHGKRKGAIAALESALAENKE
jgi:large subunit ribosomal protein L21